jgi:hypothetical protein
MVEFSVLKYPMMAKLKISECKTLRSIIGKLKGAKYSESERDASLWLRCQTSSLWSL